MEDPFARSSNSDVWILDGGFATELERRGKDLNVDHLWSARVLKDDPEVVQATHLSYFEAGAHIATACSYQASFPGFEQAGIGCQDAEQLLRRSLHLADAARTQYLQAHAGASDKKLLVAFSAGPYGAALNDGSEYDGSYASRVSEEQIMDFHAKRLHAVGGEAALDVVAFETVPCLKELRAISRLMRTEFPGTPAWVACSCRDAEHIAHGESLAEECLPAILEANNITALGVNCIPPALVAPALQTLASSLKGRGLDRQRHLIAYPNSGEAWDAGVWSWKEHTPLSLAGFEDEARQWVVEGASIEGVHLVRLPIGAF
ncbi:g11314 [Coccomyxa viridis]|uniref:G11314 protein n=1 Tax=Coccomyxa viridis TaxID=1274662 RepID=A0ABP1G7L9_9CHLO